MALLDNDTRSVLQVTDYADRTGEPLTIEEFDGFAAQPKRIVTPGAIAAVTSMTGSTEQVLKYVVRTQLIRKQDGHVRLTRLGQILLNQAREVDELAAQPQDILLAAGDEWASGDLLRAVRQSGPCMVVDPYCREPELNELARHTETTRVLIGPQVASEDFGLTLEALRAPRQIEVRVSPDIHDRHVIPDAGPVLAFGASLNRIGQDKASILVRLSDSMSGVVRRTYLGLWDSGTVWVHSAGGA